MRYHPDRAAGMYRKGIYGNTMTTNPRALEVAITVLEGLTDGVRQNIRRQGELFVGSTSVTTDSGHK